MTALYEVIPAGVESDYAIDTTDTEDYELADAPPTLFTENDLLLARLRYKEPDGTKSQLIEHLILDRITEIERCDDDFRFVAAVASWGMLLRRSGHAGSATPASILTLAKSGLGPDPTGDRAAFVTMVEKWNASNDVAGK